LRHVSSLGWTHAALAAAAVELGLSAQCAGKQLSARALMQRQLQRHLSQVLLVILICLFSTRTPSPMPRHVECCHAPQACVC
jgi:hypothetical protein